MTATGMAACLALAGEAVAAPRDAAALRRIDKAMTAHYAGGEFDQAESLLLGTERACEDRCSNEVLARIWLYIGSLRGTGRANQDTAREAFARAVELDAALAPDPDYTDEPTLATYQSVRDASDTDDEETTHVSLAPPLEPPAKDSTPNPTSPPPVPSASSPSLAPAPTPAPPPAQPAQPAPGAGRLPAAQPGYARGPRDAGTLTTGKTSVEARLQYGANLENGDLNPYNLGLQVGAGHTIASGVYFGGFLDVFFGEKEQFPDGELKGQVVQLMAKIGYDISAMRGVSFRAYGALGRASLIAQACADTTAFGGSELCVADSEGYFSMGLGVSPMLGSEHAFLVIDPRFNVIFGEGETADAFVLGVGAGALF